MQTKQIRLAVLIWLAHCLMPAPVIAQTVAILDQGVNTRLTHKASRKFVSQQCVSYEDHFFRIFGPLSPHHRPTASLCRNGLQKDSTSSSARHPRRFLETVNQITLTTSSKLEHGRDVSDALYDFDRSILHKPFQVYGFAGNLSSGSATATMQKAIATPTNYKTRGGKTIVEALKMLANSNDRNLSAVVIATIVGDGKTTPTICGDGIGQAQINQLYNRGIAVVAGLRNNDIPPHVQTWPNCLRHVINVGNTNTRSTRGGIGIGGNSIDFYANSKTTTRDYTTYGNSLSAPKIAGAFALLRKAVPNSSVQAQYHALEQASARRYTYKGVTRREIRKSDIKAAITILKGQPSIDPVWSDPVTLPLNVADNAKYGWQYGSNKHKNGVIAFFRTPTSTAGLVTDVYAARTSPSVVRLSLRGYDIDSSNEVQVLVNDKPYGYLRTTGTNRLGNTQTICIHRGDLKSVGQSNNIKLKVRRPGEKWGVTALRVDAGGVSCSTAPSADSVTLTAGLVDESEYGKGFGRDRNQNKLPVAFTAEGEQDYVLSWQAFDVEANTMSLYLNGRKVHTVRPTGANQLGDQETIVLTKQSLKTGKNTLEFRVPQNHAKWGVTNLLVNQRGAPTKTLLYEFMGRQTGGTYRYSFDLTFTRAEAGYRQRVILEFHLLNANQRTRVRVNGRSVALWPTRGRERRPVYYEVAISGSKFRNGKNTVTIESVTNPGWWGIQHVRAFNEITPLPDVRLAQFKIERVAVVNKPFSVTMTALNSGKTPSLATPVSVYKSAQKNGQNPVLLSTGQLPSLGVDERRVLTYRVPGQSLGRDDYLFACAKPQDDEWSTSNNCSNAVPFKVVPVIAPMLQLLLD